MERVKKSRREIQFYSHKNKSLIIVHSQQAYNYAERLEKDETVGGYQACVLLSPGQFDGVSRLRIRKEYFPKKDGTGVNWETDFYVDFTDGHRGVKEIAHSTKFNIAIVQQLEMSRRYWAAQGIDDWKIILFAKPGELPENSDVC